jgi:hypothetical protein
MNHDNKHCFRIETRIYNNSMFAESVDATYIIHLENNGRLPSINKELEQYKPTKRVHIVFNKGFKKCNKLLKEQSSQYDIVDINFYILKHANEKGYNNILILEDDFIFSKEIYNKNHLQNINEFLINNKNEKIMYYLGCLPNISIPYNSFTYRLLYSGGAHCIFYTYNARKILLENPENHKNIYDWDLYINRSFYINRLVYYIPLCYQLITETENKKNWSQSYISYLKEPITLTINTFIKYNKLDVQPEPGYGYSYFFGKIIGILIIVLMIVVIALLLFFLWLLIKKYNLFKMIRKFKL